ncbi:hypothetical protein MMC25_001293 [Agyrium rufum]|nr:hypothetical protein [Agyrium rufum]
MDHRRLLLDQLPTEIVLTIFHNLQERDIARLQQVSKRLFKLARDDDLWKNICFDRSVWSIYSRANLRHDQLILPDTDPQVQLLRLRARRDGAGGEAARTDPEDSSSTRKEMIDALSNRAERVRHIANWDPTYPGENFDWYYEWIAQYAPGTMDWLEQPCRQGGNPGENPLEIRGLGYYSHTSGDRIIAPVEDGSICIWDMSHLDQPHSRGRRGAIVAKTKAEFLYPVTGSTQFQSITANAFSTDGPTECVSIDAGRNKVYIATEKRLNEIDLTTLQISSYEDYPCALTALSSADSSVPLTVGTTTILHLHDPRKPRNGRGPIWEHTDRLEAGLSKSAPSSSSQRSILRDTYSSIFKFHVAGYAPLGDSGPLSILHLNLDNPSDARDSTIYVAGRFPSMLVYDRRTFPKLQNTIHSGARLSGLAALPYSFRSLETDLMKFAQLTVQEVEEAKSHKGATIIAAGEYNGKGSLEMYGLEPAGFCNPTIDDRHPAGTTQTSTYKNRISASRSKLLSVATHGTRIVVSDSSGDIKWFERNASFCVRKFTLSQYDPQQQIAREDCTVDGSQVQEIVFDNAENTFGNSMVARKLVPTNEIHRNGRIDGDEMLIWTGERIGCYYFGSDSKPRFAKFGAMDIKEPMESAKDQVERRMNRHYAQTMKRALQRQADEVKFMRGLGLGFDENG